MAWWINNGLLLSLVEPPASILATSVFILIYLLLLPAAVIRIFVLAFAFKEPVGVELSERVQRLGAEALQRMHVERNIGFAVRGRYPGAYVRRNTVVVGERLLQELSDEEIIGTIGHEVGHALKRHILFRALLRLISMTVYVAAFFGSDQSAPYDVLVMTALATFLLARIPLFWRLEYGADSFAAERLRANIIVSSLQRMKTITFDGVSFSHPPLSRRIRRLQTGTSPPC